VSFDLPGATRGHGSLMVDPAPRAPWLPAVGAAAAATISMLACLGSFVVGGSTVTLVLAAAGYLLGAIVATALWSVQRAATARAKQHTEFRPRPLWSTIATVAMIGGLVAGVASAFALATEIAK
jgi:hypothetical protein